MKHFPLNFFKTIFSVKQILAKRQQYTWWQLFVLLILLTFLFLLPIINQSLGQSKMLVEQIVPESISILSSETLKEVTNASLSDVKEAKILQVESNLLAGVGLSAKDFKDKVGINASDKMLSLYLDSENNQQPLQIKLTEADSITSIENLKQLILNKNRGAIYLTIMINIGLTGLMMNSLFIFGVAFLLYLTKKKSVIRDFKESLSITLSLLAGGTLLAAVCGIFLKDIFIMFGIQSLWLIVMFLKFFYQTKFASAKK